MTESLLDARSWLLRHPARTVWRSLVWWRHTAEPPWRQRASGLVFINPRPLDPALLAGLMAQPIPRCGIPNCPGLDAQTGMCPNGYGETCEALDA